MKSREKVVNGKMEKEENTRETQRKEGGSQFSAAALAFVVMVNPIVSLISEPAAIRCARRDMPLLRFISLTFTLSANLTPHSRENYGANGPCKKSDGLSRRGKSNREREREREDFLGVSRRRQRWRCLEDDLSSLSCLPSIRIGIEFFETSPRGFVQLLKIKKSVLRIEM